MNKVLASDLDGTLFYPTRLKTCIPKKNIHFVRKWIDDGNRLVLVSSRGKDFFKRLEEEIKRPFDFIASSGAYIVIDGKVVRDVSIPNEAAKELIEDASKKYKPIAYLLETSEHPLLIGPDRKKVFRPLLWIYKLYWYMQGKRREKFILDRKVLDEALETERLYKLMIFFGLRNNKAKISKEINKKIREEFSNVESSWSSIINEITPLGCNKGDALKFYVETLNIDPDNVYVVGDSGNDISMFRNFEKHSYVMAKAYPSVKKYAKHTIHRVYKLEKLLLKEKQNNE